MAFSRGTDFICGHGKKAQDVGTAAGRGCSWEVSSESFYFLRETGRKAINTECKQVVSGHSRSVDRGEGMKSHLGE